MDVITITTIVRRGLMMCTSY